MKENKEAPETDEISLVELLAKLLKEKQLWVSLIKKHILILLLLAAVGGSLGFYYAYRAKQTYTAKLNFVVVSESGGGMSASLSSLSSLLGVGGSSSTGGSLERMIELIVSDKVISAALFKTISIKGKSDFIINHFIALENLKIKWSKDTILANVVYNNPVDDIAELSFAQRKGFKQIQNILLPETGTGIISKSFQKKSGVIELVANYTDESFAIELSNAIYEQLAEFYLQQSTYRTQKNVKVLTNKVDSIKGVLNSVQNAYARTTDRTLGLLLQEDKVDIKKLAIKEQMLTIMYGEAQKNLETFKFMNETAATPITVINYPYSPIDPIKKSKIIFLIIGIILPCFFALVFYRLRIGYKNLKLQLINNNIQTA